MTQEESDAITLKMYRAQIVALEKDDFPWPEDHLEALRTRVAELEDRVSPEAEANARIILFPEPER